MWVESTCLWRCNRQSVPKRRHIKSRRRLITQKKAYNIQNTAKAWNQMYVCKFYVLNLTLMIIEKRRLWQCAVMYAECCRPCSKATFPQQYSTNALVICCVRDPVTTCHTVCANGLLEKDLYFDTICICVVFVIAYWMILLVHTHSLTHCLTLSLSHTHTHTHTHVHVICLPF